MEHEECDDRSHNCLPAYFRGSRALRTITKMYLDSEAARIREVEEAIEWISSKESLRPSGESILKKKVSNVWDMVYKFVISTDYDSPLLDSMVFFLVNLKNSPPVRQRVHDPETHLPKIVKDSNRIWKNATGQDLKIFVRKLKPSPKSSGFCEDGDPPSDTSEGGIQLPTTADTEKSDEGKAKAQEKAGQQNHDENNSSSGAVRLDTTKKTTEELNRVEVPMVNQTVQIDGMTLWNELPLLDDFLYHKFMGIGQLDRREKCSLAGLLGRMVAGGLCKYKFGCMALWLIRETLETPRLVKLDDNPDEDGHGLEDQSDEDKSKKRQVKEKKKRQQNKTVTDDQLGKEFDKLSVNDLLPPCITLLDACGKNLAYLTKTKFTVRGLYDNNQWTRVGDLAADSVGEGEEGFSTRRWMFWKSRFKRLARLEIRPLSTEARRGLSILYDSGAKSGFEFPGDREYMRRSFEYLSRNGSLLQDPSSIDLD
ncbi:hypothetical protein MGYG_07984 [Nannizzia gypsea CBS 118893]|uniref:Uncharacterized protein n=1 Tax=Arthroderma gypseum (strain ATCC MYA-4604 / CBS 118893) TaxID=535722 RepID=E4V4Q7_ARTGP|nr:hypothetical protein MGYG_07984 [Nannizzia gypsea CBS 118893]EFR04981.1 hypothetical protein MGYG_07984 [Nannizzia gypsea CBS 118893]